MVIVYFFSFPNDFLRTFTSLSFEFFDLLILFDFIYFFEYIEFFNIKIFSFRLFGYFEFFDIFESFSLIICLLPFLKIYFCYNIEFINFWVIWRSEFLLLYYFVLLPYIIFIFYFIKLYDLFHLFLFYFMTFSLSS